MILYCDTSALIKRYVSEEGSASVDQLWDSASAVATSVVAFAETVSAFSRKQKDGLLSPGEYKTTLEEFKGDYERLVLVPVNSDLNKTVEAVLRRHLLRGFDAIHLASALVFKSSPEPGLVFACFDDNLNRAAHKEGLKTAI